MSYISISKNFPNKNTHTHQILGGKNNITARRLSGSNFTESPLISSRPSYFKRHEKKKMKEDIRSKKAEKRPDKKLCENDMFGLNT